MSQRWPFVPVQSSRIARSRFVAGMVGFLVECWAGAARTQATTEGSNPPVVKGLARQPQTDVCERCHNPQSPHFQGARLQRDEGAGAHEGEVVADPDIPSGGICETAMSPVGKN
jgi:hypothetical protein